MRRNPYGVLKCRPIDRLLEADETTPHYQILCAGGGELYRVAVNVRAAAEPADLLYLVDADFSSPICERLQMLPSGFTRLSPGLKSIALDYVRGGLFVASEMTPMPLYQPGPDNDLSEKLDDCVLRAIEENDSWLYTYGHCWGPLAGKRDAVFEFMDSRGVHNVHMNQGNDPQHAHANGVWQDGGLIFEFPSLGRWVALFLAFQSQSWHTHPGSGFAMGPPGLPPVA